VPPAATALMAPPIRPTAKAIAACEKSVEDWKKKRSFSVYQTRFHALDSVKNALVPIASKTSSSI
jgi:hypothetical protein